MKLAYIATAGLIVLVGAGVYLVVQNENEGKLEEIQANNDRKLLQLESKFNEQAKAAAEAQRKLKEVAEIAETAKQPASAKQQGGTKPAVAGANDTKVADGLDEVKKNLRRKNGGAVVDATATTGTDPGGNGLVASAPPVLEPEPDGDPEAARARLLEEDIINSSNLQDQVLTDRAVRETEELTNGGTAETNGKLNDMQALILNQPRIARVGDARKADKDGFVVLDEGLNKGLRTGDRFAVRRGTILVARVTLGTMQATQCVAEVEEGSLVRGMNIKSGDEIIKFDR